MFKSVIPYIITPIGLADIYRNTSKKWEINLIIFRGTITLSV